jgi:aryl-alcohol dehydrogenase-like predicted oxidoreductase
MIYLLIQVRYIGVSNETAFGVMEFSRLAKMYNGFATIATIQVRSKFNSLKGVHDLRELKNDSSGENCNVFFI